MPKSTGFSDALARIMEMSYPPTTLKLPPSRAAGHRLAKPVLAKGNQPVRPVAHVDGLAVILEDVVAGAGGGMSQPVDAQSQDATSSAVDFPRESSSAGITAELPDEAATTAAENEADMPDPTAEGSEDSLRDELEPVPSDEPSETLLQPQLVAEGGSIRLELRTSPSSSRREDALQSGQAIPVHSGGEVPRNGSLVYPLAWLVEETEVELAPRLRTRQPGTNGNGAAPEEEGDDEALPAQEPARDWDLPARFTGGTVEVEPVNPHGPRFMTGIGDWARNKEALVPERTIIRAGELALLEALEVDEVEVYRRPVIGIASLAPPFPSPQRQAEMEEGHPSGQCPLITLCVELARSARIAALPLGFAPRRFRSLISAIEHWVDQTDILLLVGGSHHGPRCLALDALQAAGKASLAGVAVQPGGTLSAGVVNDRHVLCLPGSFADVLVGFTLFARPLAHKYLLPTNYTGSVQVVLDCASRIQVETPAALPVRYGWDAERNVFASRFNGRVSDLWLDYVRGQALVYFEPGRHFRDGDVFTAHAY